MGKKVQKQKSSLSFAFIQAVPVGQKQVLFDKQGAWCRALDD